MRILTYIDYDEGEDAIVRGYTAKAFEDLDPVTQGEILACEFTWQRAVSIDAAIEAHLYAIARSLEGFM